MQSGLRTPPTDPARGWYFEVKYGDSMESIAQAAGQPVEILARENNLPNPAPLHEGMLLWVPPQTLRSPATATPRSSGYEPDRAVASSQRGPLPLDSGVAAPRPMNIEGASVASYDVRKNVARASDADKLSFRWPVDPSLSKAVSTKRGLDLVADEGTPVAAARGGEILYSDNKARGLGNTIIIDHGDGYTTVYCHLQKRLVGQGQKVKKGQIIGNVGATDAEKPKLYFEIRKGKRDEAVEPLQYLPAL